MTGKDFNYIKDIIEQEGFDYCFRHYSNFEDIKDLEFHKLRKAYVGAALALLEYLGLEG